MYILGLHCLQRVNRNWSIPPHGEPGDQGEVERQDAADDTGLGLGLLGQENHRFGVTGWFNAVKDLHRVTLRSYVTVSNWRLLDS